MRGIGEQEEFQASEKCTAQILWHLENAKCSAKAVNRRVVTTRISLAAEFGSEQQKHYIYIMWNDPFICDVARNSKSYSTFTRLLKSLESGHLCEKMTSKKNIRVSKWCTAKILLQLENIRCSEKPMTSGVIIRRIWFAAELGSLQTRWHKYDTKRSIYLYCKKKFHTIPQSDFISQRLGM